MEEPYIVYYHIGKELSHTVVKGYSPAEVTYIVGQRFKKNQGFGVDGTMTIARESEMNATRFCTL